MELFNQTAYPFQHGHNMFEPEHPFLTTIVKGTFEIREGDACVALPEDQQVRGTMQVEFLDRHGNSVKTSSDTVPYKPRGEWVVLGSAYAPRGEAVTSLEVSASVGRQTKRLAVFGDRKWVRNADGSVFLTDPEPFTEMPIRAEYAHGGLGSKFNEHGIGFGQLGERPGDTMPAANIMAAGQGTVSWEKDGPYAGFGVLAPQLLPRRSLRGTYDGMWRVRRRPLPPADFDPAFYNAAPADQQVDGFLVGDEEIVLQNLHPEKPVFRTRLPGTLVRCFVHHWPDPNVPGDREFAEVNTVLDTCIVDVAANTLTLVWRGTISVEDFAHRHIEHMLVVEEPVGQREPIGKYVAQLRELLKDDSAEIAAQEEEERQAALAEMDREGLKMIVDTMERNGADPALIEKVRNVRTLEEAQEVLMADLKAMSGDTPLSS